MGTATSEELRVVVFCEGDTWVAQCLEYDIQAQGSSFQCATRRLRAAVASEAKYTLEKHGKAFKGIDKAPSTYIDLFETAEQPLRSDNVEMRIAA